jgi:hypothetical protein
LILNAQGLEDYRKQYQLLTEQLWRKQYLQEQDAPIGDNEKESGRYADSRWTDYQECFPFFSFGAICSCPAWISYRQIS